MGTQKKFFVNSNNQMVGPFELSDIFSKVSSGELKATDFYYKEAEDDWVMICNHPEFAQAFDKKKPQGMSAPVPKDMGDKAAFGEKTVVAQAQARPEATHKETHTSKQDNDEWFVLKGKNRYGPFPYFDLVKMLQEKAVFEFDYVWRQGMETWKRIAELEQFTAESVKEMMETKEAQEAQVFFRRRHERKDYECKVIIHDNARVWHGYSTQISEGGAGIIMENALMLPGQSVFLHFKPGPKSKPFNALCEIVSKRYVKGVKDKDAPLFYGIKFINIQKDDKEALKSLAKAA